MCVRVRGGVGNQLFIYAAARALSLRNEAELWLDTHSALARDRFRRYILGNFRIEERFAPLEWRFVSFPRWQRTTVRFLSRLLPYSRRAYIEQPWLQFVPELTGLRVRSDVYLDGFWQSEAYFAGQSDTIRADLGFAAEPAESSRKWHERIKSVPSIAVHCRRTDSPVHLPPNYYVEAARRLSGARPTPHFFVFSDDMAWAKRHLKLNNPTWFVEDQGPNAAIEDFRLMAACDHFITANSTYSWWAAWLGKSPAKRILTPASFHEWGHACRIPETREQIAWSPVP